MSRLSAIRPLRRGACPGLSAPMQTGDGLLVRLVPIGTMSSAVFAGLCAAARQHGNGIVEITARSSIQVRGLSDASAPLFAGQIATLGIASQDGVPVLTGPLAGIDAAETLDASVLAAALREALARSSLAARLSPKVSVAIDSGGTLGLDEISADVRLGAVRADDAITLRVGGDAFTALEVSAVAPAHCVEAAMRLLEVIARRGRDARARDIVAAEGIAEFRSAANGISDSAHPRESKGPEPASRLRGNKRQSAIGLHPLHDTSLACGIGLAFGHAHAATLEHLIDAADDAGAAGFRVAPGRALLALGLPPAKAAFFVAAAEKLGFIVRAGDPRRNVVACAGAPFCASGHIAARALAPRIAEIAGMRHDPLFKVHVSGCGKGCAHAAAASLTIVGTADGCALIAGGTARDAPFAVVPHGELLAAVAAYRRQQTAEPLDV